MTRKSLVPTRSPTLVDGMTCSSRSASRGSAATGASTLRTARCGPARRVVGQGTRGITSGLYAVYSTARRHSSADANFLGVVATVSSWQPISLRRPHVSGVSRSRAHSVCSSPTGPGAVVGGARWLLPPPQLRNRAWRLRQFGLVGSGAHAAAVSRDSQWLRRSCGNLRRGGSK